MKTEKLFVSPKVVYLLLFFIHAFINGQLYRKLKRFPYTNLHGKNFCKQYKKNKAVCNINVYIYVTYILLFT